MNKFIVPAFLVVAASFAACGNQSKEISTKDIEAKVAENAKTVEDSVVVEQGPSEEEMKAEAKEAVTNIFKAVLSVHEKACNGGSFESIEATAKAYCSADFIASVKREDKRREAEYNREYMVDGEDRGPGYSELHVWEKFIGGHAWGGCEWSVCYVKSVSISSYADGEVCFRVVESSPESVEGPSTTTYCDGRAQKMGGNWVITSLTPEKFL